MTTLIAPPNSPAMAKQSKSPSAAKARSSQSAEQMAARQRDISVSEFFAKNRHLLGFDNPRKALLTTVKEAVDNSLDACEEGGILPDVTVVIEDLQPDRAAGAKSSRYRVTVVDNGPGIVRKQVENIFGRLLYGSKFHRLKMSRGQQGIGISAAGMYGLITTGKPMMIQTRPDARKKAHHIELAMNTKTNRAEVTVDEETDDFPLSRLRDLGPAVRELSDAGQFLSTSDYPTGTSVTVELEGKYQRGRGSVDEFLELTAIANPHARITFVRPTRLSEDEKEPTLPRKGPEPTEETEAVAEASVTQDLGPLVIYPRASTDLPPETKEIQPHPKGIELGILLQMLKESEGAGYTLYNFLQEKFSKVSAATASSLCEEAGVTSRTRVADVTHEVAEKLYAVIQEARFPPPPTDCLAPIGIQQMLKGMFKGVRAEFYAASTREPAIYRGRPFQLEAAIAFGGELPADEPARIIRFANRVPLLFQQSACSSFKAVLDTKWKNYDLQQPRGAAPVGPLVIMIHMASVWVPFTSESKEAIADYDEIRKEMKLALMECGRKLGTYLRKRQKMRREGERRDVFERYIGEIAKAVSEINKVDAKKLYETLLAQARARTAVADQVLDDEGQVVKDDEPSLADGVLIVDAGGSGQAGLGQAGQGPGEESSAKRAADQSRLSAPAAGAEDSAAERATAKSDRPRKTASGGKKKSAASRGKPAAKAIGAAKAKGAATAAARGAKAEAAGKSATNSRKGATTGSGSAGGKAKPRVRMRMNAEGQWVPATETPPIKDDPDQMFMF